MPSLEWLVLTFVGPEAIYLVFPLFFLALYFLRGCSRGDRAGLPLPAPHGVRAVRLSGCTPCETGSLNWAGP